MKLFDRTRLHKALILILLISPLNGLFAEEIPKGYNTEIPSSILTPDRVRTSIGTLRYRDGFPTERTSEMLFDNLDFMRGVEVFLNSIPAASIEGMRMGMESIGATQSHQVILTEQLLDSNPLFLTGNTDTVYASVIMDLERDGPTVVEIPAGCGPGTVNDAWFRFVIDMGAPGPDRGEGGKYLILPPDYEGDVPDGYFTARSPSYTNWLILRGFLVDGSPEVSVEMFKSSLKVYPLSQAENPPPMEFINGSEKVFNTIHANDYNFYIELDHVIQKEPVDMIEPQLRGLISSIGIRKGKVFDPDERMVKILNDAVAVGNGTARAIAFQTRDPEAYLYEDSSWKTAFVGGDYQWLLEDGGRNLDARAMFFYAATVNTPAMALKLVGIGSQYAYTETDNRGDYLDGSKQYKMTIPADAPAKDFWSVVIYDPQTRSQLQTDQPFPSRNSKKDNLLVNEDGSVDLYFGPAAPEGKEENWIQTVPGKGWFTILRLYGPLDAWFDKTWRPGEIERIR